MKKIENIGNRTWQVYTLSDPLTNEVRYVGVTFVKLGTRLSGHVCCKQKTHKTNWIQGLLKRGLKPIIKSIQCGYGSSWQEAEKQQIAYHRSFCNLVNATDGGDGTIGRKVTLQTRQKLSATQKIRLANIEARQKLSEASKQIFRPVQCIETGIVYYTSGDLFRSTSIKLGDLSSSFNTGTAYKGFHYKCLYNTKYENVPIKKSREKLLRELRKQVECVETGVVYASITEASKSNNIEMRRVQRSIVTGFAAQGFHYRFVKESDRTSPLPAKRTREEAQQHLMKSIQCIETGEIYKSISQAARLIGVHSSNISYSLRKGGHCKGLHYCYFTRGITDIEHAKRNLKRPNRRGKVQCIETLKCYESMAQAAKLNDLAESQVWKSLNCGFGVGKPKLHFRYYTPENEAMKLPPATTKLQQLHLF